MCWLNLRELTHIPVTQSAVWYRKCAHNYVRAKIVRRDGSSDKIYMHDLNKCNLLLRNYWLLNESFTSSFFVLRWNINRYILGPFLVCDIIGIQYSLFWDLRALMYQKKREFVCVETFVMFISCDLRCEQGRSPMTWILACQPYNCNKSISIKYLK